MWLLGNHAYLGTLSGDLHSVLKFINESRLLNRDRTDETDVDDDGEAVYEERNHGKTI
jgi:hypothetical protein